MHFVRHVPVHQQMMCIGLAIAHHSCFHSYRLALLRQQIFKEKDSDVVTDGTVGWRRRNGKGAALASRELAIITIVIMSEGP